MHRLEHGHQDGDHAAQPAREATSPDAVVEAVRAQLVGLLHLSDCRFEYGSPLGHAPRLESDGSLTLGRRTGDQVGAALQTTWRTPRPTA
ncbi:hypothetical protein ACWCRF_07475 [Streptomyces sp. NPDC002405]|uniref:hypothetical protein n=1 Tax=Streptomyces sp. NPDC001231 TaxID=3364549 RepID=UPI0036C82A0D